MIQQNSETKPSTYFKLVSRHLKAEFIYHSSGIEGNSLSLKDTRQILNNRKATLIDVKPVDIVETRNHGKVFNELLDTLIDKEIDLEAIQTLHTLLMSTLLPEGTMSLWEQKRYCLLMHMRLTA